MTPTVRTVVMGGLGTPLGLGVALYEWWSAARTDLVAISSGLVSSWRGVKLGANAAQATGAAQPTWQSAGFGGRPAIAFDGSDDNLRFESMAGLPSGATPCEEWYAVSQQNVPALTSSTYLGASGGSANNNSRAIVRAVVSGVNRARAVDSQGAAGAAVTQSVTDFIGRHVVRAIYDGDDITIEVDGIAAIPVASVPSIGTARVTFGANNASTAASFGQVAIADRLFTALLSASQAALMYRYLMRGV